jgi:biopolymer transport protein ExbD
VEPVVQIKLPETAHAEPSKDQPPAVIWVTAQEKVFLDTTEVSMDSLAPLLKEKMKLNPAWQVALKADRKASFGLIIKVMDAAQFAGIKNLQTYTEEAKSSAAP